MRISLPFVIAMTSLCLPASCNAAGSATVVCSPPTNDLPGDPVPTLKVTYWTGADAGTPGLFWFGVLTSSQKSGSVLTAQGWQNYDGGLYPFLYRFDGGLPATLTFSVPVPSNETNTGAYVGMSVFGGHGAYTSEAREKVLNRRASLNNVRADMIAKGRWRADFDSDEPYIWALVQRDMTDNGKFGQLVTIPFVDCPPLTGARAWR